MHASTYGWGGDRGYVQAFGCWINLRTSDHSFGWGLFIVRGFSLEQYRNISARNLIDVFNGKSLGLVHA